MILEAFLSFLLFVAFPSVLTILLLLFIAVFKICRTIAFVIGFALVMTPLFWVAMYRWVKYREPLYTGFLLAIHKLRMEKMQQYAREYEETITLEK